MLCLLGTNFAQEPDGSESQAKESRKEGTPKEVGIEDRIEQALRKAYRLTREGHGSEAEGFLAKEAKLIEPQDGIAAIELWEELALLQGLSLIHI